MGTGLSGIGGSVVMCGRNCTGVVRLQVYKRSVYTSSTLFVFSLSLRKVGTHRWFKSLELHGLARSRTEPAIVGGTTT